MKTKSERNFNDLKKLNEQIKSNDLTQMENAYKGIIKREQDFTCPGILMYASYLKGKYHYLQSKKYERLENLYLANNFYKAVFQIARKHKIKAKNSKYYFKYAETSYRLSEIVWCLHEADRLSALANGITTHRLKTTPNNKSLKWLQQQLAA